MASRPIKFGVRMIPIGRSFEWLKSICQEMDKTGWHSFWTMDHLFFNDTANQPVLETWTLMTAIAAVTEQLHVGALVLCNSYRPPALLAKMGASLDALSNGRLEFAIGAGWAQHEYEAYGYPYPRPAVRIAQLDEAVQIIKKMWTEERPSFEGKYFSIREAVNMPKPVQKPHPPIHIGGSGEQLTLRVVAKYADIWNGSDNENRSHKQEVLKRHCEAVGRDYNEIEQSTAYVLIIGSNENEVKQKLDYHMSRGARDTIGVPTKLTHEEFVARHIVGTPLQCIEKIGRIIDEGPTFFIFTIPDISRLEPLHLFAEEVMPAFA
ncbi:MAG: TIGR03560 family F420-dependent LLM class oxidoreductase [Candidatus Tectomicrobia bacterium]|nr:TIGR03560 family F420-dependent LLM class oxidoreductase [Candidatus Tectomicrobia bacterium]